MATFTSSPYVSNHDPHQGDTNLSFNFASVSFDLTTSEAGVYWSYGTTTTVPYGTGSTTIGSGSVYYPGGLGHPSSYTISPSYVSYEPSNGIPNTDIGKKFWVKEIGRAHV